MKRLLAVPILALVVACAGSARGGASKNGGGKRKLSEMPVNTWVRVQQSGGVMKWLSSMWYMPATDQFICWGKSGLSGAQSLFDVETFSLKNMSWTESYPPGKERSWSGRRFPNWPTQGRWSSMKGWKGQVVKASDYCVGGYGATNRVSFTKAEGILRPTRCPTFHQACWDSKRKRMVYYVGGRTFSYDPVKREWTDLKPEQSPDWCEQLVWASLCYDAHNGEIVLFGGGMALNPLGGAPTWTYDCEKNTWRRPDFGTPALEALRTELKVIAEELRDSRCRVWYEIGQPAKRRKAALDNAVAELKAVAAKLTKLAPRVADVKQARAAQDITKTAKTLGALTAAAGESNIQNLVRKVTAVEESLTDARRYLRAEPPLRCNTQMVYDSRNALVVLFGGDAQNARLCDTWVYDVKTRTWTERRPEESPPPVDSLTATYAAKHGLVVAAGLPAPGRRKSAAWAFDASKNQWMPLKGSYDRGSGWQSISYSEKDDALVLLTDGSRSWGGHRETWVYRLKPASARGNLKPTRDSSSPRYHYSVNPRTLKMPAPNLKEHAGKLAALPANSWVQMADPHVSRKTWGSATIDTDRGIVLYYGGGHSGYSGTDMAHYNVATGRWSQSYAPEFPPFLKGTNRVVFGWSYNLHPWAEHTRKWYAYDTTSEMVVYIRQGAIGSKRHSRKLLLGTGKDGVVKTTGYASWVYDPRTRKWYPPTFDRKFGTSDSDRLVSTPKGIYAHTGRSGIWHCRAEKIEENGSVRYVARWKQVFKKGPGTGGEFDATVYDSKRHRLVCLTSSRKGSTAMTFFDLKTGKAARAKPEGNWQHFREACYIPDQDVVFTPASCGKSGYYVYRCAENRWVKVAIAAPKIDGKPVNRGRGSGPDTVVLYDPVHKVLFHFDVGNTVHLMRYDDKTVKVLK